MFRVARQPDELVIFFAASLENVDRADDATRDFFTARTGSAPPFGLMLLLREALNNAVQWGSRLDPGKTIHYRLSAGPRFWVLEVADEGGGFDWQMRMVQGASPKEDHGRGLSIMRKYARQIQYNDDGNRLQLTYDTDASDKDDDAL